VPLFKIAGHDIDIIRPQKFANEKELQKLFEKNLSTIFNCSFVASEFSTGPVHGGRIDTLAISEENNPVIIEYKSVESSQLINQSLYYLSWINDHRGDFEVAVRKNIPEFKNEIDWSEIRVICIAPEFKKYDIHAVQMMGANIELWQYRYYQNETLLLEEIFKKAAPVTSQVVTDSGKNQVMVEAGKKAALTRATGVYSFEEHEKKLQSSKQELLANLRQYILELDESVEEVPKKFYIAYKISQNFACVEVHKNKLLIFLKLNADDLDEIPANCRDVRTIGHFGTGDLEVTVTNEKEISIAKDLISKSFNNIGGN
jgi:predicted transport protein